MAKKAKDVEVEITDRRAKKFLSDVLERFENIETARGKFMNLARRERDAMTVLYEGMAALGISQKAAKTNIKIVRAMEKIRGWMADLENEDRKMALKLAKAQGDKKQMALWADLPKLSKSDLLDESAELKPLKPARANKASTDDELAATETAGTA